MYEYYKQKPSVKRLSEVFFADSSDTNYLVCKFQLVFFRLPQLKEEAKSGNVLPNIRRVGPAFEKVVLYLSC